MMRKYYKVGYFFAGMAVMALLSTSILPAAADMIQKQINIYTGVKVYVNQSKLSSVDSNGNRVEAFIYNGTTYLPVRAVAEAVDKKITWDGETNSVYIGLPPEAKKFYLGDMDIYHEQVKGNLTGDLSWGLIKPGSMIYNIRDNTGITHDTGLVINGYMGYGWGYRVYTLDQNYARLTGKIALSFDDQLTKEPAIIKIYGDDKLLYTSPEIVNGVFPQEFDINIAGVKQIKIETDGKFNSEIILSGLELSLK
ncbi:MAG TPA: stalk domain-containing protein [Syntrophomonadaceae bacterium]|nr:stalk domain-containing protein [Syntrophomonadaceae bacterium]HRX22233.1 stalk domain-containing protein [Syntrophomonadaceae bacterium]